LLEWQQRLSSMIATPAAGGTTGTDLRNATISAAQVQASARRVEARAFFVL